MLLRLGWVHRIAGWLLTLLGLVALVVGARDYWTGATVRPGWIIGGLIGIVAGTALVRWSKRARPD